MEDLKPELDALAAQYGWQPAKPPNVWTLSYHNPHLEGSIIEWYFNVHMLKFQSRSDREAIVIRYPLIAQLEQLLQENQ